MIDSTELLRIKEFGVQMIFVDLDKSLIKTDTLFESIAKALRHNFLIGFLFPFWLLKGRARFKERIALLATPEPSLLPYNQLVIDFLRAARDEGIPLVIASAANERVVRGVTEFLSFLDGNLSSDGQINLKGKSKAIAIHNYAAERGIRQAAYVGDSNSDIAIWKSGLYPIAVNPSFRIRSFFKRTHKPHTILKQPKANFAVNLLECLRPHQWVKNLLIFVPLFTAHLFLDVPKLLQLLFAFCCFSAVASSGYIANDILDIESDRRHPRKCKRPFASGELPIVSGAAIFTIILITAFGIALSFLSREFTGILFAYFFGTLLYSLWLKRKQIADVIFLAGLYTVRIFAGGAAGGIIISEWLLGLSFFIFSSLAFLKRFTELKAFASDDLSSLSGRSYQIVDLETVRALGIASALSAIMVLVLYLHDPKLKELYASPALLWLICPVFLYWVARLWLVAGRGKLDDDPIVFTLKDKTSGTCTLLLLLIATAAKFI